MQTEMKRAIVQLCLPLFAIALCSQGYSHEYPTNFLDWKNYIPSINAEADLGALLHGNIKESIPSDFDEQICKSLSIKSESPMIISFQEMSFVFHYRTSKECIESSQDMSPLWGLIYQDGKITRTTNTDQVPVNYVRIVDPAVKNTIVEIDLLLGVAPLEKPQDVKYVRRSFRFIYNNGWKEDDSRGLSPSNFIKITLRSLTRVRNSSNTLVEVSLQYNGRNKCIKISEFDLEYGVIQNCVFCDTNGVVWALAQPKGIERLPSQPSLDFRTELHPGKSIVVQLTFDNMLPFKLADDPSAKYSGKYPAVLNYQLFGEISAIACNSSSPPQWLAVGGRGEVRLLSK